MLSLGYGQCAEKILTTPGFDIKGEFNEIGLQLGSVSLIVHSENHLGEPS